MTANGHGGHVTVEGVVEARNERGLKLDGDWVNLSRFRPLELPAEGSRVRAEVDPRGYLCSIEVLNPAPETGTAQSRDDRITRLAVLKAAASFVGQMAQMHEDARSEHVIPLAERWLAWVLATPEDVA